MLALSAVLITSAIKVPLQFQHFEKNSFQFQKVAQSAVTLQEASDFLTDESRLFAITGEWSHLEHYFFEVNENKRRERDLCGDNAPIRKMALSTEIITKPMDNAVFVPMNEAHQLVDMFRTGIQITSVAYWCGKSSGLE